MTLVKDNFVSVQPLGTEAVVFPPKGTMTHRLTHFLPVTIDDSTLMDAPPFVAENFPEAGHMTAVMAVPGGAVGYHVGRYGTWWPTDPDERGTCFMGGRLTLAEVQSA